MARQNAILEIASMFIVQNGNAFIDFYSDYLASKGKDFSKACIEAENLYCEYRNITDNSNF